MVWDYNNTERIADDSLYADIILILNLITHVIEWRNGADNET